MNALRRASFGLAVVMLAGCGAGGPQNDAAATYAALPVFEMSSKSAEARRYMEEGEHAADASHDLKAYQLFKRAVAADSAYAFGYLRVANFSQSFDEYKANLARATAFKASANDIEKLLIEMEEKSFASDQEGALELAKQLVARQPDNVRSYWVLYFAESNVGHRQEAIAALAKTVELAPNHGPAHAYYGSMFWGAETRDLAKAEEHVQKAVDLWPNEAVVWDFMGDLRRTQGRLEEAAEAYSKMIALDPEDADYTQRGHVNTFLGNWDQARADYDDAIRHAKVNGRWVAAGYKAWVPLWAGDAQRSLDELEQLIQAIDGMNVPEPEGAKISLLGYIATIAQHHDKFELAQDAMTRRAEMLRAQAERIGTEEVKRTNEATIVAGDGFHAAYKGDYRTALAKAQEYMKIREPDRNPAKNRTAHSIMGLVAYKQGKCEEAIAHYDQADRGNMLQKYYRASCLDAVGKKAEAKAVFEEYRTYNFNNLAYALTRKDAIAKLK